ncbi:hypothetical protein [uncultured Methanoregula sp.]|uniref:hypothetical protein n=1 Tax=uncultured Methanoregula sp. TaxID=1005933 RepID=UPI002AABA0E8|nr:hypothetical protein [uncultured Methanoregula sp.]
MMEKAGYLQRTGYSAIDSDGNMHEVIELHILGTRYAIRRSDLIRAVSGRVVVQVEELTRNWNYYLGITRGLAQVSASGKALNVELFGAGNFTLSLASLRAVMYGKERLAPVVKIPEISSQRFHRVVEGQQKLGATV